MVSSNTMQYKMIFCDIDGTLLDSKNQISAQTKKKIQELHRINIPFILVSARMPSGIWPIQDELGIKAPIICYSGALILSERGDCVKTVGINREKGVLVKEFLRSEWKHICSSAFSHDLWIVDNAFDKWVVREQIVTSSMSTEGEISEYIPQGGHANKLLCMGEAEQIASLGRALKEKFSELRVYRSKDTYLEIMDESASKSGAVKDLCEYYGIPVESTVSFGDNYNDVDMLLATGVGFAMGNAPEEVKRQARYTTLDNDHEGVLAGLNQLSFIGII